jgi:hypothetical protein
MSRIDEIIKCYAINQWPQDCDMYDVLGETTTEIIRLRKHLAMLHGKPFSMRTYMAMDSQIKELTTERDALRTKLDKVMEWAENCNNYLLPWVK